MSVRHQVRAYIERLFEGLREKIKGGEYNIYCIYIPKEGGNLEDIEILSTRVNMEDKESLKKFLDKTTKETLESQVRGLDLLCMVLDTGKEYIISSENPLAEELRRGIEDKIDRFKEE